MSRTLLVREVLDEQSGEFQWGTRDCAALAAAVVRKLTQKQVDWPTWDDETSAAAEIARRGGLLAAVADVLGEPRALDETVQDGDVVLLRAQVLDAKEPLELMGIWYGAGPVVHAKHHLMRAHARHVVAVWSV